MRRWLVLLMVVLLPLRAVAGDAVALGMAVAAEAGSAAALSPGCPMHLAGTSTESVAEADAPASSPVSAECSSCALCFPVARADALPAVGSRPAVDARLPMASDRFRSAWALGLLRPPER
jgi:hypothetical protein